MNIWHSYGQKGGLCHALSLSLSSVVARLTKCTSVSVLWSQLWALQKRLNRSRCRLRYGFRWDETCIVRWSCSPREKGQSTGRLSAHGKVEGIFGVHSIFSTLFDRWQQRCGLSLSVYCGNLLFERLNCRSQTLSSRVVSASDCGVRGSRFESRHWQLCLSRRLLRYRVLSTGCAPLL